MTHQKPTRADLARWLEGAAERLSAWRDELHAARPNDANLTAWRFCLDLTAVFVNWWVADCRAEAARHAAREGEGE